MSHNPLIKAHDLCVTRNGKIILDHVSLEIERDDFITLIGPNGAGKSMLLKALLGLYQPDKGRVEKAPDLRVGYVPDRLTTEMNMPLSVSRFLQLNRRGDDLARIIEDTQIADLLSRPLDTLSGGERQRVLLARALLGNPDLLILDEPAQSLDINGQIYFYELLQKIYNEQNISILIVSHDLNLVMAATRKVVCLYHHICCTGTPQSVAQNPEFIALFGEDMARVTAFYPHHHDHHHDHN